MESPYACFSREELERRLSEYDGAICWDTSCLTCASLYDKLYAIEADMNRIIDVLADVEVKDRTRVLGEIYSIAERYKWGRP